jgi:hypothetical protein
MPFYTNLLLVILDHAGSNSMNVFCLLIYVFVVELCQC